MPAGASFGPQRSEQALGVEAAGRVLGREPAPVEPELVVGAAGDGEVALLRRVRPLEHAHRVNELGDDEVRVGVAVAVVVARVVDGDAVDGELEVLPLVRVEAAEEDLLGVARAALVREEEAGRELERVGRVRARDGLELADGDLVVGRSVRARLEVAGDEDLGGLARRAAGAGGAGAAAGRRRRGGRRGGGGDRGEDRLRRRRRRVEVEADVDVARDRVASPRIAGRERPLHRGGDGGRVERGPLRLDDVGVLDDARRRDGQREDDVPLRAVGGGPSG